MSDDKVHLMNGIRTLCGNLARASIYTNHSLAGVENPCPECLRIETEGVELRCVGGPLNGSSLTLSYPPASVVELGAHPDGAYYRTRPTDTDWRTALNARWFEMGEQEPVPPDHVLEWHQRGWESLDVAAIKEAFRAALD